MRLKVKPEPNFLDKKTVVKFAWFPKVVEDNIIWLEKYECTYRYNRDSFWDYYYWEVIDKKLINKTNIKSKETCKEAAHQYFIKGQLGFEKAACTETAFLRGAKWQAEKMFSKEDILAAVKYGYEFRDMTSFPEHKFEDSCINNTKQWLEWYKTNKTNGRNNNV